jgi:hypothetical protein
MRALLGRFRGLMERSFESGGRVALLDSPEHDANLPQADGAVFWVELRELGIVLRAVVRERMRTNDDGRRSARLSTGYYEFGVVRDRLRAPAEGVSGSPGRGATKQRCQELSR